MRAALAFAPEEIADRTLVHARLTGEVCDRPFREDHSPGDFASHGLLGHQRGEHGIVGLFSPDICRFLSESSGFLDAISGVFLRAVLEPHFAGPEIERGAQAASLAATAALFAIMGAELGERVAPGSCGVERGACLL